MLSATPGSVRFTGPAPGAHNAEVYGELLGLEPADLAALRERGTIYNQTEHVADTVADPPVSGTLAPEPATGPASGTSPLPAPRARREGGRLAGHGGVYAARARHSPCSSRSMVLYVVVFGWLTWQQQRNYSTFGFDMGIHDQGIWLLSRFEEPYVTVVGRNYLGHHLNLVAFAYVPFYWLGAGPTFLYLTETIVLAVGQSPCTCSHATSSAAAGREPRSARSYLLFPTIQWINWWHYHPDVLMVTPLLFVWWFATRRRWAWFAVCCVLAMFAKEDATTAIVMMGVVLLIRLWHENRRVGLLTIAGGVGWFLLATKVLMPWFNNGELAFYEDFFPGLGSGLGEIVRNAVAAPEPRHDPILGRSTSTGIRNGPAVDEFRDDIYRYYLRMLLPMCVFALRKPMLLLIVAPMVVINVLSSLSYTHDAWFHYSAIVVVAVVLASIEGAAAIGRRSAATANCDGGRRARVRVGDERDVVTVAAQRRDAPQRHVGATVVRVDAGRHRRPRPHGRVGAVGRRCLGHLRVRSRTSRTGDSPTSSRTRGG